MSVFGGNAANAAAPSRASSETNSSADCLVRASACSLNASKIGLVVRPFAAARPWRYPGSTHRPGCSARARTGQTPPFPVNRLALWIRHSGANHKRETIAHSKRRQGAIESVAKSAMRTAGTRVTNQILRGVLGGVSGGRRRR